MAELTRREARNPRYTRKVPRIHPRALEADVIYERHVVRTGDPDGYRPHLPWEVNPASMNRTTFYRYRGDRTKWSYLQSVLLESYVGGWSAFAASLGLTVEVHPAYWRGKSSTDCFVSYVEDVANPVGRAARAEGGEPSLPDLPWGQYHRDCSMMEPWITSGKQGLTIVATVTRGSGSHAVRAVDPWYQRADDQQACGWVMAWPRRTPCVRRRLRRYEERIALCEKAYLHSLRCDRSYLDYPYGLLAYNRTSRNAERHFITLSVWARSQQAFQSGKAAVCIGDYETTFARPEALGWRLQPLGVLELRPQSPAVVLRNGVHPLAWDPISGAQAPRGVVKARKLQRRFREKHRDKSRRLDRRVRETEKQTTYDT